MRFKDISNLKFGRLIAIAPAGRHGQGILWRCLCNCGNETIVLRKNLTGGRTGSCGCLRNELATERNSKRLHKKHTHTWCIGGKKFRSRTYVTWESMIQRCTNPRATYYYRYGGKGITVSGEWKDFRNFLADMGERPGGMSLDRIDNDKGYCKENCRWVDFKTQSANKSGKAVDFIKEKGLYQEYVAFVRGKKEETQDGLSFAKRTSQMYLN